MERLSRREANNDDAYAQPANFLEIEVCDPMTHGAGSGRFTEYTVVTRTNLPVFSKRECTVKRRYEKLKKNFKQKNDFFKNLNSFFNFFVF